MENTSYQIGEVQFDPEKKELIFNRYRSVRLSTKESLILRYMLDNPNKAITLAEILGSCLAQYNAEPISTRKTIQLLSHKLELADHIEYPYIDCYMFRADKATTQKQAPVLVKRIKRLFSRVPAMSKAPA